MQIFQKQPSKSDILDCERFLFSSPVLWYMQRRCSFILTGSPRGPTGPITPLGPGSPGSPCKGRDTENEPETEIVEDNAKASNKQ